MGSCVALYTVPSILQNAHRRLTTSAERLARYNATVEAQGVDVYDDWTSKPKKKFKSFSQTSTSVIHKKKDMRGKIKADPNGQLKGAYYEYIPADKSYMYYVEWDGDDDVSTYEDENDLLPAPMKVLGGFGGKPLNQ